MKLFALFQVSWVRHRDIHLLTVGRYTYTSDQRFEAVHSPHSDEWSLRIKYSQLKDSGIYECQISTTPPIGYPIYLSVIGNVFLILFLTSFHLPFFFAISSTVCTLRLPFPQNLFRFFFPPFLQKDKEKSIFRAYFNFHFPLSPVKCVRNFFHSKISARLTGQNDGTITSLLNKSAVLQNILCTPRVEY